MGSGLSIITVQEMEELKQVTPFDERDIGKLLKRYSYYDKTERGTEGISYSTVMDFPEMRGNPLLSSFVQLFLQKDTQRLFPRQFLLLFALLSPKASIKEKGEMLFQSYEDDHSGVLRQPELTSLYQHLFDGALSEQQVQKLVTVALEYPDLESSGQITFNEFKKMVPGSEIMQRLTVEVEVAP